MNVYLVKFDLDTKCPFWVTSREKGLLRLVKAPNEWVVREALEEHYRKQDTEHTKHEVWNVEVFETIGQGEPTND